MFRTLGRGRKGRGQCGGGRFRRPGLERLEDRTLLSAYYPQVPQALDTILTDLNTAVNQRVWAASPSLPVIGPALKTGNPPAELQFLTNTVRNGLDGQFGKGAPQNYLDVENAVRAALGPLVSSIDAVSNDGKGLDQSDNVEFKVKLSQPDTVPVGVAPALDLNLPQMGLTLQNRPPVSIQYGYAFELDFGVTDTDIYLDTGPNPEIAIQLSAGVGSFRTGASLGSLALTVSNGTPPTSLNAGFTLDVAGGEVSVNNTLKGDPGYFSQNSTAGFNGEGKISLATQIATNGLPTISDNLLIDWPYSGDPSAGNAATVTLGDVQVSAGSFLGSFVGPVAGEVQSALAPLTPIVDTLATPIPVLSSLPGLGGITLADVLDSAYSTSSVKDFVTAYRAFSDLAGFSSGATIHLGDYNLPGYDPRSQPLWTATAALENAPATPVQEQINADPGLKALEGLNGVTLPVFINPSGTTPNAVAALLAKDDQPLFQYTLAPLTLSGGNYGVFLPILGPLGVRLEGDVGLTTHFTFGYDTHGLVAGPDLANGFFISQADIDPSFGVKAYADLNLGVAEAGAGGGVTANIKFGVNVPTGESSVHESEILALYKQAPYALFAVDGDLEVGLDAFVRIGIGPFSVTFSVDLGHATVLDFRFGPDGQPANRPDLGDVDPSTGRLYLNMGPRANLRGSGNRDDGDEDFTVRDVGGSPTDPGGETVDIYALGFIQRRSGVRSIYAEGGEGNNNITIAEGVLSPCELYAQFNPATLTQAERDYLADPFQDPTGATQTFNVVRDEGSGDAMIYGGVGNDILQGGSGTNYIFGGQDNGSLFGQRGDVLVGGSGPNSLYAGTSRYTGINTSTFRLVAGPRDGDTLYGSSADTTFVAGTGQDNFQGGTGRNEYVWQAGDGDLNIFPESTPTNILDVIGAPVPGNYFEIAPNAPTEFAGLDVYDTYTPGERDFTSKIYVQGVNALSGINITGNDGPNQYAVDDLSGLFNGSIGLNEDKKLIPDTEPNAVTVNGSPNGGTVTIDSQELADRDARGNLVTYRVGTVGLNGYTVNTYGASVLDSLTVNAGAGDDTVDVASTAEDTTVNTGDGTNTINVAAAAFGYPLSIDAGGGANNQLNFGVDRNHPFGGGLPTTVTLTDSELSSDNSGAPPIRYTATGGQFGRGITLTTSQDDLSGGHTVYVESVLAGAPTTINTGADPNGLDNGDQVIVGKPLLTLDYIAAPLTVHGVTRNRNGTTVNLGSLSLFDQSAAAQGYFLTPDTLFRDGVAILNFDKLSSLDLSPCDNGNNIVYVLGTPSGTAVTVNAGRLADEVFVADTFGTLDGLQGPLAVNGQGHTILELDDIGNTNYSTWSVLAANTDRQYTGADGVFHTTGVLYSGLGGLVLDGGTGGSQFLLSPGEGDRNLDLLPTVTVNGGGPNDSLFAYDQDSPGPFLGLGRIPWMITGSSASRPAYEGFLGTVSGTTTFNYTNIQNLTIEANGFTNSFQLSPNLENLNELPQIVNIQQPLGGASHILLDDRNNPAHTDGQGNPSPTLWGVNDTSVTRTYNGPDGEEVVRSITFDPSSVSVAVMAGGADDSFLLQPGLTDSGFRLLPADLTIDGGAGNTSVRLDDSLPDEASDGSDPRTYTLENGQIVRTVYFTPRVVHYANLSRLEIDGYQQSSFNVLDTPANTITTLKGGAGGGNSFTVGSPAAVQGPLQINGNSTGNTLTRAAPFDEFSPPDDPSLLFQDRGLGAIAAGPDGAVWFLESNAGRLGRVTADGRFSEFPLPPTVAAAGLVAGHDNGLWFIDRNTNQVDRFDAFTHSLTTLFTADPGYSITNLAATLHGVWFIESAGNHSVVGTISSGGVRLTPLPEFARYLTAGPDGNSVWFVESSSVLSAPDHLGSVADGGTFTQVPFALPRTPPDVKTTLVSLTAGPDGNLWATAALTSRFAQTGEVLKISTTGQVQPFPLPDVDNTSPGAIVPGPHGNLWFINDDTDQGIYSLALVTPAGRIQEFPLPVDTPNTFKDALGITSGPNQALWFTEPNANQVGEFLVPQQPAVWQITGSNSGQLYANVGFQSVQNLNGGPVGADVFEFATAEGGTPRLTGALAGGLAGATLDFSHVIGAVQYSVTGQGTLHGFQGIASLIGGGFDNIDLIVGRTGSRLKIDDTANNSPTTWTVTVDEITRQVLGQMATVIPYAGVSSVEIDAGPGGGTFDLLGTAAGVPFTINGGSGGDAYHFGDPSHSLTDLQGRITLHPGSGPNSLTVDAGGTPVPVDATIDAAPAVATQIVFPAVGAGSNGAASMALHIGPAVSLAGGVRFDNDSESDTVTLRALPADAPFTLVGAGGGALTVGGPGGLDAIRSNVTIAAPVSLAVNDQADRLPAVYTLTASSLAFAHPSSTTSSGAGLVLDYLHNLTLPTTVLGGRGGNTFNVQSAEGGHATSLVTRRNDVVNVGDHGTVQGVLGALSVVGTGTTLVVDDSADPTSRTVTITPTTITGLTPAGITYSGLSSLTADGGFGGNTITIKNTAAGTNTTVNSGNGVDTVYVNATTGPLAVNTQQSSTGPGFGGFEAVYVGEPTPSGFTLDGIQGALTVNTVGRPGIDYGDLALYDSGETAGEHFTMTSNTVLRSGAAPITYHVTNQVFVYLGGGGNTFNVQSLSPALAYGLFGGVGDDTFTVGDANNTLNGIIYQMVILIQNPGSQVIINDQGSSANFGYSLAAVTLHPTVAIDLPAYRILRSDWDPQGRGASVYVAGPLYGSPPLPLRSLRLNAGSGNNTFTVQSLPPGNPTVTLDGGTGSNTLQGPDQANVWQVTGANAGTLDTTIHFANVQNLVGGSGSDSFAFQTGGGLAGKLDGGAGSNTLDYSHYVGDVTVDLPLAVATGIAGGIARVQNVTGSQGNDLLVGDANPNVLAGGTGRNVIIGGAGADQLTGGGGDSLLIGGTTSYDANLAALQAILQFWNDPTLTFDQRVDLLLHGITVNGQTLVLGSTTVHDDGAPDGLVGGAGLNWFIADPDDSINHGNGPGPRDRLTRI